MRTEQDVRMNPMAGDVVRGEWINGNQNKFAVEYSARPFDYLVGVCFEDERHAMPVSIFSWREFCNTAEVLHVAQEPSHG